MEKLSNEKLQKTRDNHDCWGSHELLVALIDEIQALRAASQWRPIDTAPRGQIVLLWKPATREHYVATRIDGGHGLGWCTPDGFEIFGATHFCPLPAPPESPK